MLVALVLPIVIAAGVLLSMQSQINGCEPCRVCRRLQLLSKVEHHEQDNEQVFP